MQRSTGIGLCGPEFRTVELRLHHDAMRLGFAAQTAVECHSHFGDCEPGTVGALIAPWTENADS
jgi:hypothetical protein